MNTLIVGSGAAALAAAVYLTDFGVQDLVLATERWGGGTSHNAGSDKQTYYKLSLAGNLPDSPRKMAEDLFRGGSMHGDIALCEAQNSPRAFYKLVELGAPFPHDSYGAYTGYRTDNDPLGRATSAGPFTSKLMFQALADEVVRRKIPIFDRHPVIALLTDETAAEKQVIGAIALDENSLEAPNLGFVIFNAVNVILATGGPAGIYRDSVYPPAQTGSTGLAFEIGAAGHNLTESQFGIAALNPRWNLSGSYQQVIPRYLSTDRAGKTPREFLNHHFPDMKTLSAAIFRKGYEWPFDVRKIAGYGSSLIDLLTYRETVGKGRRVFLDYSRNPSGAAEFGDFSLKNLPPEAFEYLKNSGALEDTPIQRLRSMNRPALEVFENCGIDLARNPLEIAVCAQHNNGGLKGNIWWESNIRHLFAIGEVNGTHGVYRPGGAALNSGQVGALRAATYISRRYRQSPPEDYDLLKEQVESRFTAARKMIASSARSSDTLDTALRQIRERTARCAGIVRQPAEVRHALNEAWELYRNLTANLKIPSPQRLPAAYKLLNLSLTAVLYLEAMTEYLDRGGQCRGSCIVPNPEGQLPCPGLEEECRFSLNPPQAFVDRKILELRLKENSSVDKNWVDIRSIPDEEIWFEKTWKEFREDNIVK